MTTEQRETNEELFARYESVKKDLAKAEEKLARTKSPFARSRQAKWCGCLLFNVLSIESELRARGLKE
jgi:hypothetical protein